ncbi:hypothetical protein FGO68_gene15037 [Halteria grandinella]|uniref:Uncharacterized protein n=1 Tax=Halteria grandinella TaxID=5974 RepID=A0A8J8NB16_HALGN|nr:hypothetical protein FGO68_gene15037 [Halteria grandinella]
MRPLKPITSRVTVSPSMYPILRAKEAPSARQRLPAPQAIPAMSSLFIILFPFGVPALPHRGRTSGQIPAVLLRAL